MKNKEDTVVDAFFWPVTAQENIFNKKTDHNFRPYAVPTPKNDQYKQHDQALFSLWNHYVEYCKTTIKTSKNVVPAKCMTDQPVNTFTQNRRLPVFQLLSASNSHPIAQEEFLLAAYPSSSRGTSPKNFPVLQMQQQRAATPPLPVRAPLNKQHSPCGIQDVFEHVELQQPTLKATAAAFHYQEQVQLKHSLLLQQYQYNEEHKYDHHRQQQFNSQFQFFSTSHDSSCHTSLTSRECGYSNSIPVVDFAAVEKMAREDCDSISDVSDDDSYQLSM